MLNITKLAAFTHDNAGGNPAGVVIVDEFPSNELMMKTAAQVGYSETVFAKKESGHIRVRYFAPDQEIAFCGHATIALGYKLFILFGPQTYQLQLNNANVVLTVDISGKVFLTSPGTKLVKTASSIRLEYQKLFGIADSELHPSLPMQIANAGNNHMLIPVRSLRTLDAMNYDFSTTQTSMLKHEIVTVALLYIESDTIIHVRNAFAYGGVKEDPATGAAAAAVARNPTEPKPIKAK